ncbi:Cobalamin synthase [Candidatus Methylomirabilis lanthanidiphila]|uniref:Adenosylcobinamide-GDP ribazoletransferase n=1 Tax=Candidatus Methylomirabilis lanthanidiphila TaxID=2211376 RepID=A0A564ZG62_9BACT|nr:adenosylcobinamide-GDP ribazoletransferase [Candidatus Methylomirabilis lanthanidiphila]VUZ84295.1 Cobalamin synthase [Candidatus Methylomirabilis lanthanidiphila]
MTALMQALSFLTIVRLARRAGGEGAPTAWTAAWFPLVGLALGVGLVGLDRLLAFVLPRPVGSTLLVVAWVAVTGALHLDGLMDCADALPGVRGEADRLRILKDPALGAFGVAAGCFAILLKVMALASTEGAMRLQALGLAPAMGRWAVLLVMRLFPYANRPNGGTGAGMTRTLGLRHLAVGTVVALVAGAACGFRGVAAMSLAGGVALLIAQYAGRRLPGLTGDVYGAVIECTEMTTLLLFSAHRIAY